MSSRAHAGLVWSTREPILQQCRLLSIPVATTWPEQRFLILCRVKTTQRNRLFVTVNALINVSMNDPESLQYGSFAFVQRGLTF